VYQVPDLRSTPLQVIIITLILLTTLPIAHAKEVSTLESISTGTTILVSVASDGTQANEWAGNPAISNDGRYVAFDSRATNLVPDDSNGYLDVFVHDRQTGATTLVSVASDGTQGNNLSQTPRISADGSRVAFRSRATNLVPNDTNGQGDIFVHDRNTGQTRRVNISSSGAQGNHAFQSAVTFGFSGNGRYVAFGSVATNLVPGDTNGFEDVFVHDLLTGATTRVSLAADGKEADWGVSSPAISVEGRYIAFQSYASNLVPGGTDPQGHIFVHDRQTGLTSLISVASDGTPGNQSSHSVSLSDDGFTVSFLSNANNLVSGDTNNVGDVFVHNRRNGQTTLVSMASDGTQGNENSLRSSLSADSRYVAFTSLANNLVPDDNNGRFDVFVHDRQTGQTSQVSVASDGTQGDWTSGSNGIDISATGHAVTFSSNSINLVPNDNTFAEDVYVRLLDIPGPPPGKPTGIRATDGTFSDRVRVTWNAATGARVYRVFRCPSTGPNCGLPIGFPKTGSFDDMGGIPGVVYFYRVRACNETTCGLFSVANTGYATTAPSKPTVIRASDGTYSDRVHVTWNVVTGATVYRVFRCLTDGPSCGFPIGYPKTGTFDDKKAIPGTVYYYRVRACNETTCGLFSVANTGFAQTAPAKPTGIKATDGTFKDWVRVTFNPVEGATVYRVFRCLTIGQTCGLPVGYPKTGTFDDRKGDTGTVYYYRVRACSSDACGLFSAANAGHR